MNPENKYWLSDGEQEVLNVLTYQAHTLREMGDQADELRGDLECSIGQSEAILKRYGKKVGSPAPRPTSLQVSVKMPQRSWEEMVAEAESHINRAALMSDLLSPSEIEGIERRISRLGADFDTIHRLDKLDWAICGVAGVLAALVDIFLIQMPSHAGFLGSAGSEGGPLANWIRERVNRVFSPEEIRRLEKENWVPYDAPHSGRLGVKVAGLGPRSHRFHSLGHDPILGFLFGVKDILMGTFTAIDKHGKWVVQEVDIKDPALIGMNLFEAIGRVFGHMKSDIATRAGLPVPLMPLFQFLQFGQIGKRGHTIGQVARIMYRNGYDFRHFLAMSISPLVIEIVVRLTYFAKRRHEGLGLMDSIPFGQKPKLQTMLFSAHLIATAANAGKVAIGQNPLMINYSQWIAFFRYAIPQLKWLLLGRQNQRDQYIQSALDQDWQKIDRELELLWS